VAAAREQQSAEVVAQAETQAAPVQQRWPESAEVLPVQEQRSVQAEARVRPRAALVPQRPP
jgi:hypothetical protein